MASYFSLEFREKARIAMQEAVDDGMLSVRVVKIRKNFFSGEKSVELEFGIVGKDGKKLVHMEKVWLTEDSTVQLEDFKAAFQIFFQ